MMLIYCTLKLFRKLAVLIIALLIQLINWEIVTVIPIQHTKSCSKCLLQDIFFKLDTVTFKARNLCPIINENK